MTVLVRGYARPLQGWGISQVKYVLERKTTKKARFSLTRCDSDNKTEKRMTSKTSTFFCKTIVPDGKERMNTRRRHYDNVLCTHTRNYALAIASASFSAGSHGNDLGITLGSQQSWFWTPNKCQTTVLTAFYDLFYFNVFERFEGGKHMELGP